MKITIVTPNFNYGETLGATISSVLEAGASDLEYIVLDGGSSDSSVEVIRSFEERLSFWDSHPDEGPYAAINEGFLRSKGQVMGWVNSDDLYLPWTLRVVEEIFEAFPSIEWLMGLPGVFQNPHS